MINPKTLVDINEYVRRNTVEENNVTSFFNEISTDQLEKRGCWWGDVTLSDPTSFHNSAGIFKQSMGVRNRVGVGLSNWPSRLYGLAKLIIWNRFMASLKV
jgi:hypothetical protein